jgi:hypothetical protein
LNRKQFILVLLALVIIGGAGLILFNHKRQAWAVREARVGDKVLAQFRFNDVAGIHIKSAHSDFNVVRKDSMWRVAERGGYPANYSQIKDLLLKLRDLKVVQSENIGPSQLARVDLNDPAKGENSGTLLEFKDANGKVIDSLLVGKRHMRPQTEADPFRMHGLFDGCYVLFPKDPENVLLLSDELMCVSPDPSGWLSRDFVKIENIKSVSLIGTNGVNAWTLSRENESWPWALIDGAAGETLDKSAAAQVVERLGFLTFIDVFAGRSTSGMEAKEVSKPCMLFVETFDHFFYTLKIGSKTAEGNYLVTAAVKADLAQGRVAENGEQRIVKENLDGQFEDKMNKLRDKLAIEQGLANWQFVVEASSVEPVICNRTRLLAEKPSSNQEQAIVTQ